MSNDLCASWSPRCSCGFGSPPKPARSAERAPAQPCLSIATLGPNGRPPEIDAFLLGLISAANQRFPTKYRVVAHPDSWTLVPLRARNAKGQSVEVAPLLDRRVSIPIASRRVSESANLMAKQISEQTGLKVHCCQGAAAGDPWGLESGLYGTSSEPARNVLRQLIALAGGRWYWLQRCDRQSCIINLQPVR